MAPPKHVAAPPNGSISVGWLWVSFLNITSQGSTSPSTSTSTLTLQAFISSEASRSSSFPERLISFIPTVAMSISDTGLSFPA